MPKKTDEYYGIEDFNIIDLPQKMSNREYQYWWVRYRIRNEHDYESIQEFQLKGWVLVDAEELDDTLEYLKYGSGFGETDTKLEGKVRYKDLVLMKIPQTRFKQINAPVKQLNRQIQESLTAKRGATGS